MRDPRAFAAAREEPRVADFASLRGAKYCLLVSRRRSGEAVPTPVWFGLDDAGRLYVRTGAQTAKVRRIGANPDVAVAPATPRGRPIGPLVRGTARILGAAEEPRAEAALKANYGVGRALYERIPTGTESVYLEVTPV